MTGDPHFDRRDAEHRGHHLILQAPATLGSAQFKEALYPTLASDMAPRGWTSPGHPDGSGSAVREGVNRLMAGRAGKGTVRRRVGYRRTGGDRAPPSRRRSGCPSGIGIGGKPGRHLDLETTRLARPQRASTRRAQSPATRIVWRSTHARPRERTTRFGLRPAAGWRCCRRPRPDHGPRPRTPRSPGHRVRQDRLRDFSIQPCIASISSSALSRSSRNSCI